MKSAALIRSLKRLATRRGWDFSTSEGGNHTKVTLNGKRSVVGRHAVDLKPGTLRATLKQLGLLPSDLED